MALGVLKDYTYAREAITCDDYDYIYLSPHLDDVALSCGGAICAHRAQGLRVLIVTLFAGDPRPPFSPLAQAFHQLWEIPESAPPYQKRKEEDEKAMLALKVDFLWLNWLDAIYRIPDLSDFSQINSYESNFSQDPAYPVLQQWLIDLQAVYPGATIVVPLGIGGHRDHRLLFHVAHNTLNDTRLLFFEDFPYVAYRPEEVVELTKLHNLSPVQIDISHYLEKRIHITGFYQSQHTMLFYPPSSFGETIRDYAYREKQYHFSECYWKASL